MVSFGHILTPKVERRKRELIKNFDEYVNRGLSNAKETERLVNTILGIEVTHPRTRNLFVEDKR